MIARSPCVGKTILKTSHEVGYPVSVFYETCFKFCSALESHTLQISEAPQSTILAALFCIYSGDAPSSSNSLVEFIERAGRDASTSAAWLPPTTYHLCFFCVVFGHDLTGDRSRQAHLVDFYGICHVFELLMFSEAHSRTHPSCCDTSTFCDR